MKKMLSLITRTGLFSGAKPRVLSCFNGCMYRYRYCSIASKLMNDSEEKKTEKWVPFSNASSSLINHNIAKYHEKSQLDSSDIMVVDSDTWRVSCGLASVCKGMDNELELKGFDGGDGDGGVGNDGNGMVKECPDVDEIEDMRVYGNLFYKVDRSSMEYEECRIDFRRKRNPSNGTGNDKRDEKVKEKPSYESSKKGQVDSQTMKKKGSVNNEILVNEERLKRTIEENYTVCLNDNNDCSLGKKRRTPTFNQLTGPYHEPFCLDIYVSKGSVRASVIHRATSNVVAVAHSISKDIKYDLGSAKSRTAAATVGKILAQRALEDDIHNVTFTPRKGDKLEGKLQIVLQSIMDNGVDVKVKLKQLNPSSRPFARFLKS